MLIIFLIRHSCCFCLHVQFFLRLLNCCWNSALLLLCSLLLCSCCRLLTTIFGLFLYSSSSRLTSSCFHLFSIVLFTRLNLAGHRFLLLLCLLTTNIYFRFNFHVCFHSRLFLLDLLLFGFLLLYTLGMVNTKIVRAQLGLPPPCWLLLAFLQPFSRLA